MASQIWGHHCLIVIVSLVSIEALADENSDESLLDSDCFEPRNTSTPTKATDKNTKTLKNKKSPRLETMVINCDGLKGQKSRLDFQAAVAHHTPDIILGCESKLDATLPTYSIFSEDYNIICKDRTSSGGGVFIAFKNSNVTVDLPILMLHVKLFGIIWSLSEQANCT